MTVPGRETDSALARSFPLEGGLSRSLATAVAAVLVIEGAVLHLWVASRSHAWAWAITAINLVTLVWLWREVRAGAMSALMLDGDDVRLAVGKRLSCRVPRSAIASAERATWRSVPDVPPRDYVNTAKPLEPNVMLRLREPVPARLPLGVTRPVTRIGLRVHDPELLILALSS